MNYNFLNHNEIAEAILAIGTDLTPMVLGEPGIGKTSVQHMLARLLAKTHQPIYLDMPNLDVGYLSMMVPDRDTKKIEEYTGSLLCLDDPRPKLIMCDEAPKMPRILHPTMTRMWLERSVGNVPLPKGSIVWGTGNMTTDGVGDFLPAHSLDRICTLYMGKPNADQLNAHYSNIGVTDVTRAWLAMNPRYMHSYLTCTPDELKMNPVIFNPAKRQDKFLTPRSLHKADTNVVKRWDRLKPSVAYALLAGTIGEAAAQSLATFIPMAADRIPFEDVIANPMTTRVPDKDAVLFLMIMEAVDKIETHEDMAAFIDYLERKHSNMFVALFYTMALSTKRTTRVAKDNSKIKAWIKIPGNYQMVL